MRIRGLFVLAFLAAVALAMSQVGAKWNVPTPADEPKSSEPKGDAEPAPGKGPRASAFIAAFDKGDAKAVAEFYTPDAVYLDETGRRYKGRAAIEKLYSKLFAEHQGAKLAITVNSTRMIGADNAIIEGISEVTLPGSAVPSVSAYTGVLTRKDGQWYFESVQDSVAHPPSNVEHFEDLEWLLGDWVSEAEKGEGATASYSWAENRNFIVSHFTTTLDGLPIVGGTQWIGWDAIDKQIRSWTFYSGGGVGEAVWMQEGNKWTTRTAARTRDGRKVTGSNSITKVDRDHLIWQVANLTVDGKAVPDQPPVKMKRVKP